MLVFRALILLFRYDLLSAFCSFRKIYVTVKRWEIASFPADAKNIARICDAVNWACAWYPKRALCLQRSFVTTYLLRKHGIAAQLVIGAQKLPFRAHAWVEVKGRAINERSNVQVSYAVWDRC